MGSIFWEGRETDCDWRTAAADDVLFCMHFILWPNQCFRHLSAPLVRSIRTDGQRESRHLLSFSLAIFAFKIAVNITKPTERDLNSYGWFSIIKNFVTFLVFSCQRRGWWKHWMHLALSCRSQSKSTCTKKVIYAEKMHHCGSKEINLTNEIIWNWILDLLVLGLYEIGSGNPKIDFKKRLVLPHTKYKS